MAAVDEDQEALIDRLVQSVGEGTLSELRYNLRHLEPVDLARLLESVPVKARSVIWSVLEDEHRAQALQHLPDEISADFLSGMDADEIAAVAAELDTDDFVDLVQQLPDRVVLQVLDAMDAADRARVEAVLSYPEDSAGGLMNTDAITVRAQNSIALVQRYLRRFQRLPDDTDSLFVVNARDEYVGVLPLARVLTSSPELSVREVMETDLEAIPASTPDHEVARRFAREDLVSGPVVDERGRLLGRITVDDVVDVIIEDADEQFRGMAGLDESSDTFAPVLRTTRRRAVWLGINLVTAVAAAAVISLFEATIAQVVALAVLMPIVPSMGGIAATQTLTLTIRGMALGHIARANVGVLLNRELLISILNGLLWSVLIALGAVAWFGDPRLGIVIATAVIVNMFVGAAAGAMLPLLLEALDVDPAVAGGVIVTTITDVVGFFVFLGLAAALYA